MRLIDADKLDELVGEPFEKFLRRLDLFCPPTINAIPLEWIKTIINTNRYLWEQNKERMFVDHGVVKVVNYSITAQILSELIERWKRESGNIKDK